MAEFKEEKFRNACLDLSRAWCNTAETCYACGKSVGAKETQQLRFAVDQSPPVANG